METYYLVTWEGADPLESTAMNRYFRDKIKAQASADFDDRLYIVTIEPAELSDGTAQS